MPFVRACKSGRTELTRNRETPTEEGSREGGGGGGSGCSSDTRDRRRTIEGPELQCAFINGAGQRKRTNATRVPSAKCFDDNGRADGIEGDTGKTVVGRNGNKTSGKKIKRPVVFPLPMANRWKITVSNKP